MWAPVASSYVCNSAATLGWLDSSDRICGGRWERSRHVTVGRSAELGWAAASQPPLALAVTRRHAPQQPGISLIKAVAQHGPVIVSFERTAAPLLCWPHLHLSPQILHIRPPPQLALPHSLHRVLEARAAVHSHAHHSKCACRGGAEAVSSDGRWRAPLCAERRRLSTKPAARCNVGLLARSYSRCSSTGWQHACARSGSTHPGPAHSSARSPAGCRGGRAATPKQRGQQGAAGGYNMHSLGCKQGRGEHRRFHQFVSPKSITGGRCAHHPPQRQLACSTSPGRCSGK